MKHSIRVYRRLIAKIGIAAVLFAQLAVSAYACPMPFASEYGMATAVTAGVFGMPDCGQSDTGNPNLCLQHCQAGSQSVQTSPQIAVPTLAIIPLLVVAPIQPVASSGITVLSALPERETSPPPLVRFSFLRI